MHTRVVKTVKISFAQPYRKNKDKEKGHLAVYMFKIASYVQAMTKSY